MNPKPETTPRVFIAAVPTADSLDSLDPLRTWLAKTLPGVRWTKKSQLHVTVLFLGDVEKSLLEIFLEKVSALNLPGNSDLQSIAYGQSFVKISCLGGPIHARQR